MASSSISTVGVVGLGTMGAGIVEVFARGGLRVVGVETDEDFADRGRRILNASVDRAVDKGKLTETERDEILGRVTVSTSMDDLATADLVVEAVPEIMKVKHEVFGRLDGIVAEDAVLATNTSSLSVTEIAAGTAHPERVVGMHFFNPAPVMKLVEVITTVRTDEAVRASVAELAERCGKKPVVVGDRAGFVANYLLFGYFVSAFAMLEQGHTTREDLDTAMRVGAGLPMGPCTLADLVGLDVCHHIGEVIYAHSRSPRHAPSTMLERMVTAGLLGRKSGRGFYSYERPGSGRVAHDELTPAAGDVPEIVSVGLIGTGEVADDLATRFEEGGFTLTRVTDPEEEDQLRALAGVDLVVEAGDLGGAGSDGQGTDIDDEDGMPWVEETGDRLWTALADVVGEDTVLTTVNPGAACQIGALSGRPTRAAVLRVHAPTANGQCIEIGRSVATDDAAVAALRGVVTRLGAEPVVCRDRAGLVVDALLMPHLNDAVRMLDDGYASVSDIDTALRYGLGYPAGPFAMIDAVGADEVLEVCEELYRSPGSLPRDAADPSPLLVEHVILDRRFTDA